MAVITLLEPEPRSGGVRVRVDGAPFATVSVQDAADLGLEDGRRLDDAALEALAARADAFGARAVALRLLASRALPARELLRRLLRRGHSKRAAESALGSLTESGLVDDGEFARHYARTRARRKRFGAARLVLDLRRLGVDEKVAVEAVSDALAADGVDSAALVRDAAERKLRSLTALPPREKARRLRAYLLRRGFAAPEVAAVVKEAVRS